MSTQVTDGPEPDDGSGRPLRRDEPTLAGFLVAPALRVVRTVASPDGLRGLHEALHLSAGRVHPLAIIRAPSPPPGFGAGIAAPQPVPGQPGHWWLADGPLLAEVPLPPNASPSARAAPWTPLSRVLGRAWPLAEAVRLVSALVQHVAGRPEHPAAASPVTRLHPELIWVSTADGLWLRAVAPRLAAFLGHDADGFSPPLLEPTLLPAECRLASGPVDAGAVLVFQSTSLLHWLVTGRPAHGATLSAELRALQSGGATFGPAFAHIDPAVDAAFGNNLASSAAQRAPLATWRELLAQAAAHPFPEPARPRDLRWEGLPDDTLLSLGPRRFEPHLAGLLADGAAQATYVLHDCIWALQIALATGADPGPALADVRDVGRAMLAALSAPVGTTIDVTFRGAAVRMAAGHGVDFKWRPTWDPPTHTDPSRQDVDATQLVRLWAVAVSLDDAPLLDALRGFDAATYAARLPLGRRSGAAFLQAAIARLTGRPWREWCALEARSPGRPAISHPATPWAQLLLALDPAPGVDPRPGTADLAAIRQLFDAALAEHVDWRGDPTWDDQDHGAKAEVAWEVLALRRIASGLGWRLQLDHAALPAWPQRPLPPLAVTDGSHPGAAVRMDLGWAGALHVQLAVDAGGRLELRFTRRQRQWRILGTLARADVERLFAACAGAAQPWSEHTDGEQQAWRRLGTAAGRALSDELWLGWSNGGCLHWRPGVDRGAALPGDVAWHARAPGDGSLGDVLARLVPDQLELSVARMADPAEGHRPEARLLVAAVDLGAGLAAVSRWLEAMRFSDADRAAALAAAGADPGREGEPASAAYPVPWGRPSEGWSPEDRAHLRKLLASHTKPEPIAAQRALTARFGELADAPHAADLVRGVVTVRGPDGGVRSQLRSRVAALWTEDAGLLWASEVDEYRAGGAPLVEAPPGLPRAPLPLDADDAHELVVDLVGAAGDRAGRRVFVMKTPVESGIAFLEVELPGAA